MPSQTATHVDVDVAVIGGGPGGMAAALSFIKAGFRVKLFERYHCARPAGNILNLWPPAVHALTSMGVDTNKPGAPCLTTFRNAKGHVRATVEMPQHIIDQYQGGFIGLLRPELYKRMLDAIPDGVIEFNSQVEDIEDCGDHVRLRFSDGRDGTMWGIVEAWPDAKPAPEDLKSHAASRIPEFPDALKRLVQATAAQDIQRWPIRDRVPLKKWSKGRITLSGDAAHATSPYAAYGAGMSICDGYFLAQGLHGVDLADTAAVVRALAEYEACQLEHTTGQVNNAYFLGQVFHHTPFPLTYLRDLVFDWTGFLQQRAGDHNPKEIVQQLETMGPGITEGVA